MSLSNTGKLIGGLFLLQMLGGIFFNFFFMEPFKVPFASMDIAALSRTLGMATLLSLTLVSVNLVIGAVGYQLFKGSHPLHSLLMLTFAILAVGLTAVECNQLGQMVALVSQLKAENVQSLEVGMELLRKSLAFGRNETHFMAIFLSSFSLLLFYALLYRASLLPRWLMGFANLACVLQLIAMGSTFFQGQVLVLLQLPLLLTQIAAPVYLIVNGIPLPATTEPTTPMPMNERC